MGGVTTINSKAEFDTIINSGKPVVIDFTAAWSTLCNMMFSSFVRLAMDEAYKGVECYKIDVDELHEIAVEFGIRFLPTFLLFKNGEKVGDGAGASPPKLKALLATAAGLV